MKIDLTNRVAIVIAAGFGCKHALLLARRVQRSWSTIWAAT
ncbi:hypothetical protein [Paraburkholderia sp. CNPSo 3281]|nr:hypothetical protein [Paraburkholderia sp. CNPSo 3281]